MFPNEHFAQQCFVQTMLYWINQVLFRALQVLVHWGRQLNNHTIQLNNKQSLVEKDTKHSFVDVHLA